MEVKTSLACIPVSRERYFRGPGHPHLHQWFQHLPPWGERGSGPRGFSENGSGNRKNFIRHILCYIVFDRQVSKKIQLDLCSRFDVIPACDRQTDRRTHDFEQQSMHTAPGGMLCLQDDYTQATHNGACTIYSASTRQLPEGEQNYRELFIFPSEDGQSPPSGSSPSILPTHTSFHQKMVDTVQLRLSRIHYPFDRVVYIGL